MKISQDNKQALRNPWVLGWLALVVVVFSVNIFFVATAVYTNPGLVEKDYYERGRDREENIRKKLAARTALGWEMRLDVPEDARMGRSESYRLTVVDRVGMPLRDAQVSLHAYRPSDADADFRIELAEANPGQYEAPIAFPLKGLWDLKVNIVHKDDSYDIERRVIIRE